MSIRNLTHGALTIEDGAAATLTIPIEEGNLQFTVRREAIVILNRGTLASMAEGMEEAMAVSFAFKFEEWRGETASSGSAVSPADALRQVGNASGWTSTLACGPYCVDLTFMITAPSGCGEQDEELTFPDFHADEVQFQEGEEYDIVNVTGKCLALEPT